MSTLLVSNQVWCVSASSSKMLYCLAQFISEISGILIIYIIDIFLLFSELLLMLTTLLNHSVKNVPQIVYIWGSALIMCSPLNHWYYCRPLAGDSHVRLTMTLFLVQLAEKSNCSWVTHSVLPHLIQLLLHKVQQLCRLCITIFIAMCVLERRRDCDQAEMLH